MSPLGHEVLAPEDHEEVDPAGPPADHLPVVLHPDSDLWVLKFLDKQRNGPDRLDLESYLFKVEHVGIVSSLTRHLHLQDVVLDWDRREERGHPCPWAWPWSDLRGEMMSPCKYQNLMIFILIKLSNSLTIYRSNWLINETDFCHS